MTDVRYTLRQLQYFVAAAEFGTFKAAAESCHVSEAGIALALSEFERNLGAQLLVRRRAKGITVTPAGQQTLIEARAILSQAEELQLGAVAGGGQLSGQLRVGCYTGLAPFFIPPVLATFAREHPHLRLQFVEDTQVGIQRRLMDGELEAALLYDRGLHNDVECRPVVQMSPYALLPADHPLAAHESVSLEDLAEEPLIRLDLPPLMRDTGVPGESPAGQEAWYHTPNFELVRCLVGRGLGYAILVQRPAGGLTYDGHQVVSLPIRDQVADVTVVLAYPRGAKLTRRAEVLWKFCQTTLPTSVPPGSGAAETSRPPK